MQARLSGSVSKSDVEKAVQLLKYAMFAEEPSRDPQADEGEFDFLGTVAHKRVYAL